MKKEVITSPFTWWEVTGIMSIPLSLYDTIDEWTLQFSENGHFIVKSAYHVGLQQKMDDTSSSSYSALPLVWQTLWEARVPPKIKNFG